jgi:hypothetical protein
MWGLSTDLAVGDQFDGSLHGLRHQLLDNGHITETGLGANPLPAIRALPEHATVPALG